MNSYDRIKELQRELAARGLKVSVKDLIVLAPQNDPFYCGAPSHIKDAEWFASIWAEHSAGTSHLRRIHYRLVSADPPHAMPDGAAYENTNTCDKRLNQASKYARSLDFVDPDEVRDNRNAPTTVFLEPSLQSEPYAEVNDYLSLPHLDLKFSYVLRLPPVEVGGYDYDHGDQPYYLLLIVEKTTMDDILVPICKRCGVNYLAGAGFTSITRIRDELRRMQAFGKPVRVFYVSDFDPAGDGMPRAVSRQTEFWLKDFSVAGIKIHHLGLTRQQCVDYRLSRTPLKDSDRRKTGCEHRYGEGATELDALEGLHPGELARIVIDAVKPYRDTSLRQRLSDAEDEATEAASTAWKDLTSDLEQELDDINDQVAAIVDPYRKLLAEADQRLDPVRERLEAVCHAVRSRAAELDDHLPPRPETEPPDESGCLFDSSRGYLDQLEHYQAHKDGVSHE